MAREIEHWECGDIPPLSTVEEQIREFVDENVYAALIEYGSGVRLRFNNDENPDSIYLYVAEAREDDNGVRGSIGTKLSLREEVLENVKMMDEDEAIRFAEHLEQIAKDIRSAFQP